MKWTLWCGQRSRQKWDLKLNNRKGLQENPTRCHPTRKTTPRHLSAPKLIIRLQQFKKLCTLLDLCVSSLRRGHANLLCIVPILTDDPRRESKHQMALNYLIPPCTAHTYMCFAGKNPVMFWAGVMNGVWNHVLRWCCLTVHLFKQSYWKDVSRIWNIPFWLGIQGKAEAVLRAGKTGERL